MAHGRMDFANTPFARGIQATVLTRQPSWAQVRAGQFTGWVAEGFIHQTASAGDCLCGCESSECPGCSWHGYKLVWKLKSNERATIIVRSGEWAKLKSERYEGWVHGDYLTAKPALTTVVSVPATPKMSSAKARKILIGRSIALYRGRCPCPYNVMKNGRRCGGNSAYSRTGRESPLCYPGDASDEMVRNYIARQ